MPAAPSTPRLLIYSQDGLGLGHLRRTTLLATEFLRARPGASVLTVCDSPIGQFFATTPGHEHLKLPSVRKLGPGNWTPVSLAMPFTDVLHLRKEVIRAAAQSFRPDVVLVDHMPHGAMGELLPALGALRQHDVRMVLGLRDILDAPATVRQRWRLEGAFEAIENHYDEILVYGLRGVFDVAAQYDLSDSIERRLTYCGYVCSPPPRSPGHRLRKRLLRRDPEVPLIVAMAGGGADGYDLFHALLGAMPQLLAHRKCRVLLVTGPFLPEPERARLHELARGLPVVLRRSVPDAVTYLDVADLVVAMAGYNTTAEILSLGRAALLVPRRGPSLEQRLRAQSFAERGWVRWLSPDALSPESLADAMAAALDARGERAPTAPDLYGRQRAVQHLLTRPLAAATTAPVFRDVSDRQLSEA